MNAFTQWLVSTASSAAFLGFLALIFKSSIVRFFEKRIEHGFDAKLAKIQNDLENESSKFTAIQSMAMSSSSHKQSELHKRKILAADKIWEAAMQVKKLQFAAEFLRYVNFEKMAKLAQSDQNIRTMFEGINSSLSIESLKEIKPENHRPFVPDMTWAIYSAYTAIIMHYYVRLKVIEIGAPPDVLLDGSHVHELILKVLPHQKPVFEKFASSLEIVIFLKEIEDLLAQHIARIFDNEDEDKASAVRAAEIVRLATELHISDGKSLGDSGQ